MIFRYFVSSVRSSLKNLVTFNAIVAIVGAVTARLWKPDAPMDEIVVVVTLPVTLTYIVARVLSSRNASTSKSPQAVTSKPADESSPLAAQTQRNIQSNRRALWGLVLCGLAIAFSFSELLAVPFYAWMGIAWAIWYALTMMAALFAVGLCGFFFALSRLVPGLSSAAIAAARVATSRFRIIFPGSTVPTSPKQ